MTDANGAMSTLLPILMSWEASMQTPPFRYDVVAHAERGAGENLEIDRGDHALGDETVADDQLSRPPGSGRGRGSPGGRRTRRTAASR